MRSCNGMVAETRHRQTGEADDLPQDVLFSDWERRTRKDADKRKSEECGIHNQFERNRTKLLARLLFGAATLVALFLVVSFQSDMVLKTGADHISIAGNRMLNSKQHKPASCGEDRLVRWLQVSDTVRFQRRNGNTIKIGLVNFKKVDSLKWELLTGESPTVMPLKAVKKNLNWSDFFPEQLDEDDQPSEPPACPNMPMPSVPKNLTLDMVVAAIPCDNSVQNKNWARDIRCLQAFLAAARVAAYTESLYVVLCAECRPVPNLFVCKELLEHHDGIWLYKLDLNRIRRQLTLPIGTCELAIPVKSKVVHDVSREAYATILHSAESYVCGAITLAHSIRMTGSTRPLVLLVDETINAEQRQGLEAAGWTVWKTERIRNPKAEPSSYNEWNYSKFRLWQLTQYDKLIYIDADVIVLRNLDFLFDLPEITATENHESLFNSGVMVIEPSNCTFEMLLDNINSIESYNGGDQGYLNEIYTWWHRIPVRMNYLKFFDNNTEENTRRIAAFTADPPVVYAMHFLGIKPWLCFRDYDCNWNQIQLQPFANDAINGQWWKVHDTMPQTLQKFCLLQGTQKFLLDWDRRKAEIKRYPDEHWKIPIKDPRWHAVEAIDVKL